jgi:hypothetical protein
MSSTVVTYEHLTFPDLQPDEARRLQRRLEQVEYAARLFGSGLLGVDVELSWALGRSRPVQWVRAADGSLSVHIWLNLQSNRSRPEGVETGSMKAGDYVASFRTGFLHALGRALYSPNVWMYERAETAGAPGSVPLAIPAGSVGLGMGPLEWALRRSHPLRRTLPRSVRIALEEPEMRAALGGLFEELEDARVDGTLADSFAGSVRELAPRRRFLQERAAQEDPVVAFVSRVALALASKRGAAVAEGRDRGMTESLEAAIAGLRSTPDAAGAWPLAELLVFDLLPVLLSQEEALARLTEGFGAVGEGEVPQIAASPPSRHGMRFFRDREPSMDPIARPGARGTVGKRFSA